MINKKLFPNTLTATRGVLAIIIIILFFIPLDYQFLRILILFIFACLTDFFDGYLARRWQVVSDFGKVFDPLFDKVLTFSLYFLLAPYFGYYLTIIFICLVIRDVITDGFKAYLLAKGKVVPAIWSAKLKTNAQMLTIILALLFLITESGELLLATYAFALIALILSYYSGMAYTKKFFKYFKN